MVDMEVPSAYVQFLRSLMPRKPRSEIYNALGLQKQGKTLFYRDFLLPPEPLERQVPHRARHQGHGDAGVRPAVLPVRVQGDQGLLSRRRRTPTREQIKDKYLLVKQHDRVGRMADTLEYSDVAFPRDRFDDELIDELREFAPVS